MHRLLLSALAAIPCLCSLAIAQTQVINTIAGNGTAGTSSAQLNQPSSVAVDSSGNIYIADTDNGRIQKLTPAGVVSTVAGTVCCGYSGDGGPATSATLDDPMGIAVDSSGNIYIADTTNSVIREVNAGTGVITTIAGKVGEGSYEGDGGPAVNAVLWTPQGVAVDSSGNVYIADTVNNVIRKITAKTGDISTVAGDNALAPGYSGDNGPATSAQLYMPTGVFVDASGNIFIADKGNNRIREVTASNSNIKTVAGNGNAGYTGDGGPATSAALYGPTNVAVDSSGNIFIAVSQTDVIREVSAASGNITTVAGEPSAPGFYGDGGNPIYALLNHPAGVALDSSDDIYIADTLNNRVREVTTVTAAPPTIKPNGVVPVYSTVSTIQPGEWISIYGSNLGPATPVTWTGNFPNGDFPTSLAGTSVTIDGIPAYPSYVSAGQVNVQVPDDSNVNRSVNVVVSVGSQTVTSAVNLASVAPSFSLLADALHVAGIIIRTNGSGAFGNGTYDIIGPVNNTLGYKTVPAQAGDNIELFGVGFGPTSPAVPAGQVVTLPNGAPTTNAVTLTIGTTPVVTSFTGISEAGVYQFNLTLPSGLGTGDVPISASVTGVSTSTGEPSVVIALQ